MMTEQKESSAQIVESGKAKWSAPELNVLDVQETANGGMMMMDASMMRMTGS